MKLEKTRETDDHKKSNLFSALMVLFIFINLALLVMIIAPPGHYALSNVTSSIETFDEDLPEGAQLTTFTLGEEEQAANNLTMILEWRLVDSAIQGDYTVETYREYEIYKNDQGKTVKTVPTSNYDYLRYWRYEQ